MNVLGQIGMIGDKPCSFNCDGVATGVHEVGTKEVSWSFLERPPIPSHRLQLEYKAGQSEEN